MQDKDVHSSVEVFASYFAFFDTLPDSVGGTSLQPSKARSRGSPLGLCWHDVDGAEVFLWFLAGF